jgi:uncharacterized protein YfaP (DUF2135 family)
MYQQKQLFFNFEDYLNDVSSSQQIMSNIQQLIQNTVYFDSSISVKLHWQEESHYQNYNDDEPRIDLHVYEPDGTHVYYGNTIGNIGKLITLAYWYNEYPVVEYYASFDKLVSGMFLIGVNYYTGYGSNIATIDVQTCGNSVKTYDYAVESAAEDNDPVLIAKIVVKKSNGGFNIASSQIV